MAEVEARLQPLHQAEDVAARFAGRVPPSLPAVADDQDFAFSPPVLQAESGALLPVELPGWWGSLEHDGAMHLVAQFLDLSVVSGHVRSSRHQAQELE